MKFKVGDKVKIKDSLKERGGFRLYVSEEMAEYKGKTVTIETITSSDKGIYEIEEDNGRWSWSGDMFEVAKYDYEDLKKSPIGTKVTFEKGNVLLKTCRNKFENETDVSKIDELTDFKDKYYGKIIKIEEPTSYTTVYEAKVEILDETEKRYLRGVIRPFRNKVKTIVKYKSIDYKSKSYIGITLEGFYFNLPYFDTGAMYNGMKAEQKYTLKELGL